MGVRFGQSRGRRGGAFLSAMIGLAIVLSLACAAFASDFQKSCVAFATTLNDGDEQPDDVSDCVCMAGKLSGTDQANAGAVMEIITAARAGKVKRPPLTREQSAAMDSAMAAYASCPRRPGPAFCPRDFTSMITRTSILTCNCTAKAVALGSIWGTDIYTADSSICRAGLHAGVIGLEGGTVTLVSAPGRADYKGTSRNGVASQDWGASETSYRFKQ